MPADRGRHTPEGAAMIQINLTRRKPEPSPDNIRRTPVKLT